MLACRHSIHSNGDKGDLKAAVDRYPEPVKGAEGVFYCGYNSEKSYGGSAWLVVRKEGNVMIDSPRFDPKLVKRVKVRFITYVGCSASYSCDCGVDDTFLLLVQLLQGL